MEAARLDEVLRASRSIMNAARTLSLLQPEAEEIDREEQPLLVRADLTFRKRLGRLWGAVEDLAGTAQSGTLTRPCPANWPRSSRRTRSSSAPARPRWPGCWCTRRRLGC